MKLGRPGYEAREAWVGMRLGRPGYEAREAWE